MLRIAAAGAVVLALTAAALALEIPAAPPRFVYDRAGLLSAGERASLEDHILALDREGGPQVGVAIFPSLEGEALEDFTIRLAEKWKPGHAGRDDGVIVALFLEERKIRIEVGYGLEGVIPDGLAGRIIRNTIAPAFRQRRYLDGLSGAVGNIAAAARGDSRVAPDRRAARTVRRGSAVVPVIILLLFLGFALRTIIWGRPRSYSRGKRSYGGPWWWGGGSGGGGSWGGGGGFSGGSFGGGSFGGGGASGGW
jgi:uncharacterized protein